MKQFKEWRVGVGRLEVQVLDSLRQRKPGDEEGNDVRGREHGEKGQRATYEQVVLKLEALPGTNDHLENMQESVKGESGKIYKHLVKNCSDEAFGIVRLVEWRRG